MRKERRARLVFIASNVLVWFTMTAILVVVPDLLERWMSLALARIIGWGVAGSVWVIAVEPMWKARFGPIARFVLQLILWVSAALVAITISESAKLGSG